MCDSHADSVYTHKFHSSYRELASAKTNSNEKYGEDLEKMKVNGPGKRKLGQGRNYGTD